MPKQLSVTLVPNRDDRERYVVLVSYEPGPMADYGATMVAVRREWRWLNGPRGWVWTLVRITHLPRVPGLRSRGEWIREWPRNEPQAESEALRRERILILRERIHVDTDKAYAIPDWDGAVATAEKERRAGRGNQGHDTVVDSRTPLRTESPRSQDRSGTR